MINTFNTRHILSNINAFFKNLFFPAVLPAVPLQHQQPVSSSASGSPVNTFQSLQRLAGTEIQIKTLKKIILIYEF